ncbi:MAG: hypothetical protein JWN94_1833 [Betaproteobacteria bacterium]|nr:hypothetical protein [Betaproteobacteria bacterium]
MLLGQGVMINWSDVSPEHRAAYYEWHSREHMPGRVRIEGFLRGRRYLKADAGRDFLVLYEVADVNVLTGANYLVKANAPSELTRRTTPVVKNSVRGLGRVKQSLGIGSGGCALTLRFDPAPGADDRLENYLAREALPALAAIPEIVGAHLIVADREASSIVPEERKNRPTVIPNWIVVLEGISLDALAQACDAHLSAQKLTAHGCGQEIARETYTLQLLVPKPRVA